ncbi:1-phosphatidylinositol 4-kinase LSB6 NDAI_0G05420 [Naumovozyma dairenensis CBS 421]|uniref:Phosphatidylinositol 4-kinase n=1 Tax=Naumovozyma dairenensis (strain ATCC 10597 / BCRC 20456 / CBS 421 / NBRC 0211 / NRRL Y-12639) TaxID=1071378 RepID=J7SBS4_NAUDC|nr:hypothetical protein NDAI_0G05420 [Naumovozyma dairenensis CBS 421]CCK73525.1 hypothetical protein NDAI_0G05420 [Naumovozyma dairenensis CBS 421]
MSYQQTDHYLHSNKLVTSNSYDWLKYRDEQNQYNDIHPLRISQRIYGAIPGIQSSISIDRDTSRYDEYQTLGTSSPFQCYKIEFPIFKVNPDYPPRNTQLLNAPFQKFQAVVTDCKEAISERDIELKRVKAGSSGSYFVYGTENPNVPKGIFKPKDEEPYGPLSPKWTKWAHRTFFPCLFGRSCLIPNLGYVCESAASLLDRRLETNLVPFTDTVSFQSASFYDQRYEWLKAFNFGIRKQEKVGSFQLFLEDYQDIEKFLAKYPLPGTFRNQRRRGSTTSTASNLRASTILSKKSGMDKHSILLTDTGNKDIITRKDNSIPTNPSSFIPPVFTWSEGNLLMFRQELEKLIILDYIMRNTDRGLDNWMIKVEPPGNENQENWSIELAAIDNGLCFPWKHPDEWRLYPYGWLYLSLDILAQPFSENTRSHFIPLLTSTEWWEDSYLEFTDLFQRDPDFQFRLWKKQWAVLKGQAFNVVNTLSDIRQGPLELVRKTRYLVVDEVIQAPASSLETVMNNAELNAPTRTLNGLTNMDSDPQAFLNDETEYDLHRSLYRTVIAERLQMVTSDPVFTWC